MFRKYKFNFIAFFGLSFFLNHFSYSQPNSDELRSFCGIFLTRIHYFSDAVEGVSGRIYETRRMLQLIQASLAEVGRSEILEDPEKFAHWDEQLQGLVFAAMDYHAGTRAELNRISDLAELYNDQGKLSDAFWTDLREEDLQAYRVLLKYFTEDLDVVYTSIYRAYREYEDEQWNAGKASHVSYYELLSRPDVTAQLARAMSWDTISDVMSVGRAVEAPRVPLPSLKELSAVHLSQLSTTEYPYRSYVEVGLLLNQLSKGLDGLTRVPVINLGRLGRAFSAPITRELSMIKRKMTEARSNIVRAQEHLSPMHVTEALYRLRRLEAQLGVYELFLNYLDSFHPQLRSQGLQALRHFGNRLKQAFAHGSDRGQSSVASSSGSGEEIGDHPVGAYQSLRTIMGSLSGGRPPREMPSSYMDVVHWSQDVATLSESPGSDGEMIRVQNHQVLYILVKRDNEITTLRKGDILVDDSEKNLRIYDPVSKKMVPPTIYVLSLESAHNDEGTFGMISVGVTTAHNHIEVRRIQGAGLKELTHRYDLVGFYRQVVAAHNENVRLLKEQPPESRTPVEPRMRWGAVFGGTRGTTRN